MAGKARRGRGVDGKIPCSVCGRPCAATGLGPHEAACKRKAAAKVRDAEAVRLVEEEDGKRKRARIRQPSPPSLLLPDLPGSPFAHTIRERDINSELHFDALAEGPDVAEGQSKSGSERMSTSPPLPSPPPLSPSRNPSPTPAGSSSSSPPVSHHDSRMPSEPRAFNDGDIKVEYHPRSGRESKIYSFEDYARERPSARERDDDPWHPFSCRDDFELAEALLVSGMKRKQVETVLNIVKRISEGRSDFSLWSYQDLESAWEQAALFHASVRTFRL